MSVTEHESVTDCPEGGEPPIWATEHLLRRIGDLPEERRNDLAELWTMQQLGEMPALVTAEDYARFEKPVNLIEGSAPMDWAERDEIEALIAALAQPLQASTRRALLVYAGIEDVSRPLIMGKGRYEEAKRILAEALAYNAQVQAEEAVDPTPSVADLPPVDDNAELVASNDYPGTKADAKTIMAWVGTDKNRAARAYGHEQDRATQRKGVTAKLIEVLGPEGLATVTEAMAAAAPPPMNLGDGLAPAAEEPTDASPQEPVGEGAGGTDVAASEPSGGVGSPVDAEPPAPALSGPPTIVGEEPNPLADAVLQIGVAFAALADALRKVA